jgi:hypothetical protein
MRPFVHGDDAVATAVRRREHRPSCDDPFSGAHQTSLDAWRSWVADQGEASAQSDQAWPTRPRTRLGTTAIRRLGQAIRAALIGMGQRVHGVSSPPPVSREPKGLG